jgi:MtN3 and saliva related transmembrane protein
MTLITIVGIAASVLTATSMMPQLIKILRNKEAESVSIMMLAVLFAGLATWIWYGILIDDIMIVISNSFSMLINILTVLFSIKYKKQEGNQASK